MLAGASQIGTENTRLSTSQVLTPFGLIMATAAITKAATTALHPATVPGVLYYPISAASSLVLRHAALVLTVVIVAKRLRSLLQEFERDWLKTTMSNKLKAQFKKNVTL